jgi:DNA-binding transcriptional regulator YiaG
LRFVQFPSFLRDWHRLGLDDEALCALEQEGKRMATPKAKPEVQPRRKRATRGAYPKESAGSKIVAAIEEATEILRSEGLESPRITIRTYKAAPASRSYKPEDVKRVRELLGTSQAVLASFLGVNVNTVRSWEQGNASRSRSPIAF